MPLLAMFLLSYVTLFKGGIFLIISMVLIAPYMVYRHKLFITNRYLLAFFALTFFGSLLNLIGTDNGIGGTLNLVVSIGVALFCIENIKLSRYFILLLCIYFMIFIYKGLFVMELGINEVFEGIGLSKNYPGFIMVACCCYWGMFKYINKKEFPLLLPILCTVLAFFLDGRSSLGVLFAISLFSLYCQYKKHVIIFIIIVIAFAFYFLEDIQDFYMLTSISDKGMETSRYKIWSAYFDSLDLSTLVVGLNTMDIPLLKSYGGNPHNAFLNFHYRMGLFGLFGLLMIICRSVKILIKRKQYVILMFVVFLLVRIFFDACLGSSTDYIIYTIILYPILCNNRVFRKKRQKEIYKKIVRWRQKSQKRNIAMSRVLLNVERYI